MTVPSCGVTRFETAGRTGRQLVHSCALRAGHDGAHDDANGYRWSPVAEMFTSTRPAPDQLGTPPDRRTELLNAIAQASIIIQRSVAELEQLGEQGPVRCESRANCWGGWRQCELLAGHTGEHRAGEFSWQSPKPLDPAQPEQRYCGMVANATGVEVTCERLAGHDGPHKRGEMTWPNLHRVCHGRQPGPGSTLLCVLAAGHEGLHRRGAASW